MNWRSWCLLLAYAVVRAQESKAGLELKKNRYALEFRAGTMSGPGARLLERELAKARFVMLGEQHATHEIPLFAGALCSAFRPDAVALEAGQFVTKEISTLSPAFLTKYPDSIAFYAWTEEIDFVKTCRAAGAQWIWGLDQEFLGAATYLLDEIAQTNPGQEAGKKLAEVTAKCAALDRAALSTGSFSGLCLTDLPAGDLLELKRLLGRNARALELLEAFLESQQIYQLYTSGRGYESNARRAQYLKARLTANLEAIAKKKPQPKVLLKFGDNHARRGLNPLNIADLGNFIGEIAAREGRDSLHIVVMGRQGERLEVTGFGKPLKVAKAGESAQRRLFAENALEGTWTVFDVRPLRAVFASLGPDRETERWVFGTDLVVMIPTVSAAHPLGAR